MAWLLFLMLATFTLAALLWRARPGGGGLALAGAALILAAVGYAWQGHPSLAGSPTPPRANHPAADTLFAAERPVWLGRVGPEADLLDAADALIRQGAPDYAIGVLRGGIARAPNSMALWIGLGNALATYADGSVTPPARWAFDHAAALAPRHPAPAYFLGLAYAEAGDLDSAEHVWRALLVLTPANASYRPLVVQRLTILARLRAMVASNR